jgi:hypothetical protein
VYFDLAAWSIRTFGISQVSTRLVSVAGVLLLAAAGGLAAVWLAGGLNRGLAAAGFLLIAPELNAGNVAATMHPVGVALEIVALAGVAAVARWPASWWPGLLAGSGLAGAALTTPRAYPCVLAFVLAGVLWRQWAPGLRRSWTVAVTLAGVAVVSWAIASGGLAGWVDLIWTVFSSEDRDVALLPTAARNWAPSGGMLVTAVAGVIGTLVAARALATPAGARLAEAPVLGFALLWMWITGVASLVSMSYVSASRIYWAVPVLAVALAVPYERLGRARVAAWLAAGLLVADVGVTGVRWARIAATWESRDPARIEAFVREHIPPGSAVIGPEAQYLVAVEKAGSRYFHWRESSHADWARWAPVDPPEREVLPVWRGRYLIWPTREELPGEYACAAGRPLGQFVPASTSLHALGPLGVTDDRGFLPSRIYALSPSCPEGYDPTGARR